ncbi:alpha/beta hydrolase [Arthrobacter sp. I2-34]|uniref:Alpha/beta hydrolase n=1 Tax=Arthrobacter hankyongi TaxID=2904801 RepID=A0ABS9L3S8_9MICC|nr:alpha/beta hydrolase [Arthrobacter hankyongi]MCG2621213.1 alpha/beta hydrolase [Arthrobacter hankyongi]
MRTVTVDAIVESAISQLRSQLAGNPAAGREAVAAFMNAWPAPQGLLRGTQRPDGINDWHTVLSGRVEPQRRIVHVHGGGFTSGSGASYGAFLGALAQDAEAEVISCDYRLAPEHPFPAGLNDVHAAFERLITDQDAATTAVVADSAGSALVLAAVSRLPLVRRPAALVFFSPLVDLATEGGSYDENADGDALFSLEQLRGVRKAYARGASLQDPELSPLFGPLAGMPPTLIFASTSEVLRDNAVRLHEALVRAGGHSDLRLVPGVPHAWPVFGPSVSESADALAQASEFLVTATPAP